jgi:hypothetical protein
MFAVLKSFRCDNFVSSGYERTKMLAAQALSLITFSFNLTTKPFHHAIIAA